VDMRRLVAGPTTGAHYSGVTESRPIPWRDYHRCGAPSVGSPTRLIHVGLSRTRWFGMAQFKIALYALSRLKWSDLEKRFSWVHL
jgi:hypothetical protein